MCREENLLFQNQSDHWWIKFIQGLTSSQAMNKLNQLHLQIPHAKFTKANMNYPFMIAACIFIEGNHNTINRMLHIELRLIDSSLWSDTNDEVLIMLHKNE